MHSTKKPELNEVAHSELNYNNEPEHITKKIQKKIDSPRLINPLASPIPPSPILISKSGQQKNSEEKVSSNILTPDEKILLRNKDDSYEKDFNIKSHYDLTLIKEPFGFNYKKVHKVGIPLLAHFEMPQDCIYRSPLLSPNTKYLACIAHGPEDFVYVWDINDLYWYKYKFSSSRVDGISFTPDSNSIIIVYRYSSPIMYNLSNGKKILEFERNGEEENREGFQCTYTTTGTHFAYTTDKSFTLWSLRTGKIKQQIFDDSPIKIVDNEYLICIDNDLNVVIKKISSQEDLISFRLKGVESPGDILDARCTNDMSSFLYVIKQGIIRYIFNDKEYKGVQKFLCGVEKAKISEDCRYVLKTNMKNISIYDIEKQDSICTLLKEKFKEFRVDFINKKIIVIDEISIDIQNYADDGAPEQYVWLDKNPIKFEDVKFSRDSKVLLARVNRNNAVAYDLKSGYIIKKWQNIDENWLDFSMTKYGGDKIAIKSHILLVKVWNFSSGREEASFYGYDSYSFSFNGNGSYLACGTKVGPEIARIWDIYQQKYGIFKYNGTNNNFHTVVHLTSPEPKRLICCAIDQHPVVFNTHTTELLYNCECPYRLEEIYEIQSDLLYDVFLIKGKDERKRNVGIMYKLSDGALLETYENYTVLDLAKNIKQLKSQLETASNLIDYFLVCGVHPNICKERFLYDIKNEKYLDNLKEKLKPTILSKFPNFDISRDTIDEEIINYCFPTGFAPIYSYNKVSPKLFSIILDNNLFSTDYPQKYLTCLLFYEKVTQYKLLQLNIENRKPTPGDHLDNEKSYMESDFLLASKDLSQRKTIESELYGNNDKTELGRATNISEEKKPKLEYYYIPKCICIVSIHPFVKLFERILGNIYRYSLVQQNIPIEKIITNLIIEVPIPPRGLYSIQYILVDELFNLINFENNKLQIAEINFRKFNNRLGFETIIEGLKHILLGSKIMIFSSNLNYICDTIISFLYLLFPFKYPFQVSSYLHKNNYELLETVSPFILGINESYTETFFTDNEIIIDEMNIFVIDLDKRTSESFLYDSFPEFPKKLLDSLEKEIRVLEVKFKTKKFNQMGGRNSVSSYSSVKERESNTSDGEFSSLKNFNENYQYYFFNFFCEILKNYEKYLNMDYFNSNESDKLTSIETLFNCKKFINSHHGTDIPFYSKFVLDSQLFSDFIYKRMLPRNNQEIIDVLLVNETIIKIKNRNKIIGSQKTNFLDSKGYKILGKYAVPKPREVNKVEKEHLFSKINEYKRKGQIIKKEIITQKVEKEKETDSTHINNNKRESKDQSNNKNFLNTFKKTIEKNSSDNKNLNNNSILSQTSKNKKDEDTKENIIFYYLLFPELDFDLYCNNENVNDYYSPPSYSDEIEAVNTMLISKSSLGQNINKNIEMKNYIYLTWLEVWSFTFWYIEKNERQYRFNQMLDIIDKIIHHEMNIFNLIFDVLNQQNEHEMILNLYQKLLQKKINPSTFIYNIISNILDKDQIKELLEITKQDGGERSLKLKMETINLKERTFLNNYDKSLISSKLKFETAFTCIKCQHPINLYTLCQKFDNIKNDILWVPCNCGEYNLPKINVKFGLELFPSQKSLNKKVSTSVKNEIVLFSPYNLKLNIREAVMTHYGGKLNIHNFKTKSSALFWNFIWYCYLHHLDYTIILPYLKNLEQSKEKAYNNPNNETFQTTFNNEVYKKIATKMYEPSSSRKADKETMQKMLKKVFKIVVVIRTISFEIHKVTKDKNKKLVSQFIDHINGNKVNAITSLMMTKTIKEGAKINDKKTFQNSKKVGATMNVNIVNNSKTMNSITPGTKK